MSKAENLTGCRFGRLTVIERAENTPSGRTAWHCRCDCGKETIAISNNLKRGKTTSCGCYNREVAAQGAAERFTTHHETRSRLYRIWGGMKKRCYEPNSRNFQNWGGRGISMCDEWRNSYEAFRDWALANGYEIDAPRGKCTLDRIDNNGNYEPGNCRWVDMKTQAQNRRPRNIGVKI